MYSKVSRYWTKFQEYWTKHFQLSGGLDATDPQLPTSSDPTFFRIILQKYIVGHCKYLVMLYMEKMIKEEIEVGQYVGTVIVKPGKRAIYVILWSVFFAEEAMYRQSGQKDCCADWRLSFAQLPLPPPLTPPPPPPSPPAHSHSHCSYPSPLPPLPCSTMNSFTALPVIHIIVSRLFKDLINSFNIIS